MRKLLKFASTFYGVFYAICFALAFFVVLALVSDPPEPRLVLVCMDTHACDGVTIERVEP